MWKVQQRFSFSRRLKPGIHAGGCKQWSKYADSADIWRFLDRELSEIAPLEDLKRGIIWNRLKKRKAKGERKSRKNNWTSVRLTATYSMSEA